MIRVHGELIPLEGYEVLRPVDTEAIIRDITSEITKEIEEEGEADFFYAVRSVGRSGVNAFRQRGLPL